MVDQDALNHAVDLLKDGVTAAYGVVKDIAPQVWELSIRQTRIDGIECFVGSGVAVLAGIGVALGSRALLKKGVVGKGYNETDYGVGGVFLAVFGGLACTLAFMTTIVNGLDYYLNPAYWAMLRILAQLHK